MNRSPYSTPQEAWPAPSITSRPASGSIRWMALAPSSSITASESAFDPNQIVLAAFEPSGDFNGDGNIDAADYVAWRKLDGSQQGYNAWRTNFGRTSGTGSDANAAVPEPTTVVIFVVSIAALSIANTRQCHKLIHQWDAPK